MKERKEIYQELLDLLSKSELAARNGEWMTCGTCAKNAMDKAYEYGKEEREESNKIEGL